MSKPEFNGDRRIASLHQSCVGSLRHSSLYLRPQLAPALGPFLWPTSSLFMLRGSDTDGV